jgi:hypothetical protein
LNAIDFLGQMYGWEPPGGVEMLSMADVEYLHNLYKQRKFFEEQELQRLKRGAER